MEMTPPRVRPTTMGVREANLVQACRWHDDSGWGKEGVSWQGGGSGNYSGNVVMQAAGGG
jgi:hypothetical protein